MQRLEQILPLLRCPSTGQPLRLDGNRIVSQDGSSAYALADGSIPLFAEQLCSDDARVQQIHYDRVAAAYATNLEYPHTQEYMASLDRALLDVVRISELGTVAEVCCGTGEAFKLLGEHIRCGVGVDISVSMLKRALAEHRDNVSFVQGDATRMPLASASFDSVFMLGGVHHVRDRTALFAEIYRILKPGGMFYYREPVDDCSLWRGIRWLIYRLSPALDHETERPLRHEETVPVLAAAGMENRHWTTHGFLGFCLFMNSDILVFNRLFRFIPGIRAITRWSCKFDEAVLRLSPLQRAGLQVVGVAQRPHPDHG